MTATIEVADHGSSDDLAGIAAVLTAFNRESVDPDEPATPVEEIRMRLRLDRDDIDAAYLVARDGRDIVGFSFVDIRRGHGNEHMAWVADLYVLASHRRRGIGRALLDATVARARDRGRTLLTGGFAESSDAGAAFVRATGMRTANRERQNRVAVATLDRAMLESWNVPAPGYSLVCFDGRCPDDLLDDFIAIQRVMNDAPHSESIDDFVFTPELRRAAERELERFGTEYWFAGARHDASGELAGFTELVFHRYAPWLVEQGDTAVAPAHRGHGIGRWLKAVNALRVLDEKSEARVMETWNDGSNKWMLAINDAMGFRPAVTWVEAELDI